MTSTAPALVATDLDRTLIYSRAAMTGDQFDTQALLCVEYYEGAPLSYVTDTAAQQLRTLADEVAMVPTTTRTPEQFRRIDLPGGPWRYAIASNGGSIIEDGHLDPHWRRTVEAAVRDGGASLDEVTTELRRRISEDWVSKFRIADELFCYLVVDVAAQPVGFLDDWHEWCSTRGWNASQQGRKIYTMPNSVCKSRAVAEVHRRLPRRGVLAEDAPVFAAGDGALDADAEGRRRRDPASPRRTRTDGLAPPDRLGDRRRGRHRRGGDSHLVRPIRSSSGRFVE